MKPLRRNLLAAAVAGLGTALAAQASPPGPPPPETYGGAAVSYLRIPGVEFLPAYDGTTYTTAFQARYATNACSGCFRAPLHLPAGAKLVSLELDFIDTNASTFVDGSLAVCDYASINCVWHPAAGAGPVDCFAPDAICSGTAFALGPGRQSADLTPDNLVVDNVNKTYVLQVDTWSFDSTTMIGGMLVGYVLQVSPPPAFATFNDVPTNHPFFPFIEALVGSGITAGCGSGKYCPDTPITRGQMAVFLAKALGLQWP